MHTGALDKHDKRTRVFLITSVSVFASYVLLLIAYLSFAISAFLSIFAVSWSH